MDDKLDTSRGDTYQQYWILRSMLFFYLGAAYTQGRARGRAGEKKKREIRNKQRTNMKRKLKSEMKRNETKQEGPIDIYGGMYVA